MSKNIAVMEGNIVVNVIVCPDDFVMQANHLEYFDSNPAFIDGDYVDGYFYAPRPSPNFTRDGKGGWLFPTPQPTTREAWMWNSVTEEWYVQPGID